MATKENIANVYSNLDPRVRLGVQIVGLTLGVFLILKLLKGGRKLIDDKPFVSENQEVANELQVLNQNPSTRQTISNSQAMAFANKIFSCMNGKGTYEEELIGVFYNIKNIADFLAVEKAFGVRTIYSKVWLVDDFRGTLSGAIADELDVDYIKRINSILAKKGIKRRI